MIVTVLSRDRMRAIALPANVTGGHWIEDAAGERLAFMEEASATAGVTAGASGSASGLGTARAGAGTATGMADSAAGRGPLWRMTPADGLSVRGADGDASDAVEVSPDSYLVLSLGRTDGARWSLVFNPESAGARTSQVFGFSGPVEFTVGREADNALVYPAPFVSAHHARLAYDGATWQLTDLNSTNGVFVNGARVAPGAVRELAYGDVVTLLGLNLTLGAGLFSCNNPGDLVAVSPDFVRFRAEAPAPRPRAAIRERAYFYPALRFARAIDPKNFVVDAPPQPEPEEETSLAMRIGPSAVMALASVFSAFVSISTFAEQGSSMIRALPMVGMAVAMLLGSVLWPVLSSRSQRRRRATKEARRRAAYSQYLGQVLASISEEERVQREVLETNRVSVKECLARAYTSAPTLMDRTSLHADYLELRIGLGDEPLQASIRFPESHFTIEDDDIRRAVDEQASVARVLRGVPVAYPLIDKPVLGVIGAPSLVRPFVRGLMVQLAALVSYEDVKLVVLADEAERAEWSFALHLPHCFSDDRSMRYVAFGLDEAAELGMFMERVLEQRRKTDHNVEPRDEHPYYVVVCASETLADRAEVVRSVVGERVNRGVSLIACAREMRSLPKECRSVINLDAAGSYLLDRDDPSGTRHGFAPDIAVTREMAEGFAFALGKVRLDIETEEKAIPSRLGFLEMEHVGSVEHLSIAQRWAESNASATLACPVGVDALGDPFILNLHEKFHGPHGLIAGTTGSGKSEFIITWILSMAVTYSPNDVAFVLIDYKGGGLAKAFDNEHVHLPHLAGVITNLDGAAITRSLVSIKSELKRRQALFNRARDIVGGDNVDIYSYLDLFRQGRVSEPCPHLFIVADEFAELKQQEPDFMDELISAARIGRSLGVHLVLATQKPSGVVNDQIWSNSRFKVCLKVADEADSKEMLRRPDAAALTQAGRFYLLVGYNEHFALGQAAYAGTRYVPRERCSETADESVTLVSDTGRQLVSVKPEVGAAVGEDKPESVAVLQLLQRVAAEQGVAARQLWLEPVPALVTADGLAEKYGTAARADAARADAARTGAGASATGTPVAAGAVRDAVRGAAANVAPAWCPAGSGPLDLAPLIGELDDPERQRQALLRLPISAGGNALVYGTAESGAELVLHAALYGLLRSFGPADLHVYALDFGTESLQAFASAPQVGDVVLSSQDEKVRRFFDFIEHEQAARRRQLAEFGGSFERYRAAGGCLPALLVLVNDIAALLEAYPKLEDRIVSFVREAGRYGIYLVMTADGTSSVRVRMRQTFRQTLAVNLADASDYAMIFGTMRGIPVPRGFGRGLARVDDGVFEFQAARLTASGDDYARAMELSNELANEALLEGLAPAPAIPTVPEVVTPGLLLEKPSEELAVPFGIYEDSLGVASFEFDEVAMVRALYQRRKSGAAFAKAVVATATQLPGWQVSVLDAAEVLGAERPQGCSFATRKPERAAAHLREALAQAAGNGRDLLIISGIASIVGAVPFDQANELKQLLQGLSLSGGARILLLDALADATYAYDDWFKAQLTSKSGLWVGPGLDGQSALSANYTPNLLSDAAMRSSRAYLVDGGAPRLVRLVSLGEAEA